MTTGQFDQAVRFHGKPHVLNGGLPYLARLPLEDRVLVLRDVVERFEVRNTVSLRNLLRCCADSVGALLSAKRVSDYLKSQHLSVSPQIVIDYLAHLEAAFLIHRHLGLREFLLLET